MLNKILKSRKFPEIWKKAIVVLLEKPKKKKQDPQTYRPICLLDIMGKTLEHLICNRLKTECDEKAIISPKQHGFLKGKSTLTALAVVKNIAEKNNTGDIRYRKFCALVTVDVKNAFGTASWEGIARALKKHNVSKYLIELITSYLTHRKIILPNNEERWTSCGVPQGSVLGPLLWLVLYDQILNTRVNPDVELLAYADDLAIIAIGRNEEEITEKINHTLWSIQREMVKLELEIEPAKTELVVLMGRNTIKEICLNIEGQEIISKEFIKYLGVTFDRNTRMTKHLELVTNRAAIVGNKLARLMPNIGGPVATKRRIIAAAAQAIILYGAPTWIKVLKYKKHRKKLENSQRSLLIRICSAYRTTSTEALQVMANIPPLSLLAEERTRAHEEKGRVTKKELREDTMKKWQNQWKKETGTATWTKRLIPQLKEWTGRKHGIINYHLSQMIGGHGCFASYLHRFGITESNECAYCGEQDDVEHTIFKCPRWQQIRTGMEIETNESLTPENTISVMLKNPEKWKVIEEGVKKIILTKEKEEREGWTRITLG